MSLLLNGSKTMTIAGTEMQCIEIYTGESYTLPFTFTYANSAPINCNGWSLTSSAKFYSVDTVTYPTVDTVDLGNLSLLSPQPSTGVGTYSANLVAAFSNPAGGLGYLYIPADLTGGTGTGNLTPTINLANSGANSTLVIVTMGVSRTDALSTLTDFNKEPIGIIVRYQ
jgi:hypothetical protein